MDGAVPRRRPRHPVHSPRRSARRHDKVAVARPRPRAEVGWCWLQGTPAGQGDNPAGPPGPVRDAGIPLYNHKRTGRHCHHAPSARPPLPSRPKRPPRHPRPPRPRPELLTLAKAAAAAREPRPGARRTGSSGRQPLRAHEDAVLGDGDALRRAGGGASARAGTGAGARQAAHAGRPERRSTRSRRSIH